MTATRIVRGATIAVGTGLWVVSAWLLWRTTVPSSLRLPHVDERMVFGARLVRDAQRYERFLDWEWIVATLASLGAYVVVVRRAHLLAPRLGLGPINAGIILGVLTVTALAAVTLPFLLVENWWERRHGISREGYGGIVLRTWGALLGTTLVVLVALAVMLALAHRLPRLWWVPAAVTAAAILLLLQLGDPYLARLGAHPVRSARLSEVVRTLEQREHAGHPAVRVADVRGRTRAANAFSLGIGPSETVVVWNTLLGGRFTKGEVRFVIGHELGHLVRNHILRAVGWFFLLALPVLLVTALATDVRRPAAVPLALLVIAVATLALLPLRNAISRRYEAEADWIGLTGTRDPGSATGLFRGFVATSLEDPSPPSWVRVWLDDHPTPLQRVEMARAWKLRDAG